MKERFENMEATEQVMDSELINQQREHYMECSREAAAAGYSDMAQYYEAKANELQDGGEAVMEQPEEKTNAQRLAEMNVAHAQEINAEIEQTLKEQEERQIVHGAPDYAGVGGWSEQEYLYEAEVEYSKNGDSAEYNRLLRGAAKAHVREEYGDAYHSV